MTGSTLLQVGPEVWVGGVDCEVSSPASVQRLADAAVSQMGSIDVWINNAGFSGTYQVMLPPAINLFYISSELFLLLWNNLLACLALLPQAYE